MLSKGAKTVLIVFAVLFGIAMLLCGLIVWAVFHFIVIPISDRQEAKQREYEAFVGNINSKAVAYIEDKYGFTAEVTQIVQDRKGSMFGSVPANRGGVYMTYNSTPIFVYYDLDTDIGYDDYQYETVYAAVEEIFRANGTGFTELLEEPSYGIGRLHLAVRDELEDACNDLLHVYYDGSNLGEVLAFSGAELAGCYTGGVDFSTYTDWRIPETLLTAEGKPITLRFLSFRNKDYPKPYDLEKFTLPTAAPYVSSYCCFQSGEAIWKGRYDLHDYDGAFQYCVVYPDGIEAGDTAVTIAQGTMGACNWDAMENWFPTGDAFHVTATTDCTIYLFFNRAQQQALMPGEKYRFGLAMGDENNAEHCHGESNLSDSIDEKIYSVEIQHPNGTELDLYPLYKRPAT
ncbi:MAG: hypothetical protein ACI4J3_05200 [Oscillospiraceae bacterium]